MNNITARAVEEQHVPAWPKRDAFEILKQLKREAAQRLAASVSSAPPSRKVPQKTRDHRRNISWDQTTTLYQSKPKMSREKTGDAAVNFGSFKIRLDHVTQQHPLVSETETLVLEAIERRDPTCAAMNQKGTNQTDVFPAIPQEAFDAIIASQEDEEQTSKPSVRTTANSAAPSSNHLRPRPAVERKTGMPTIED